MDFQMRKQLQSAVQVEALHNSKALSQIVFYRKKEPALKLSIYLLVKGDSFHIPNFFVNNSAPHQEPPESWDKGSPRRPLWRREKRELRHLASNKDDPGETPP